MADPKYLLDTNVCIRVLAGTAPETVRWLESLAVGEAIVSAITYAELVRGILPRLRMSSPEELESILADQRLERQFLQQIPVLPFGKSEAVRFAQLLVEAGLTGRLRADWLIAAHALSLHMTLVTADRDFNRLHPHLKIHQLDDIELRGIWP